MSLTKVQAGQSFAVKAATWNAFIDAANYVQNLQNTGGTSSRGSLPEGWVYVRNNSGTLMRRFAPVVINGLASGIDESVPDAEPTPPVFLVEKYDATVRDNPIAVLQEPLKENAVGRALLNGVTPCRLNMMSAAHLFAVPSPTSPDTWESAESGPGRILWSGAETEWGFLHLGGTGGSVANGYAGNFLVIDVSEKNEDGEIDSYKIRIVNGMLDKEQQLSDHLAGYLVTQTYNAISAQTFTLSSEDSVYVILKTTWNVEEEKYRFEFEIQKTLDMSQEDFIDRKLLAYIRFVEGKLMIFQIWTDNVIDLSETRWV